LIEVRDFKSVILKTTEGLRCEHGTPVIIDEDGEFLGEFCIDCMTEILRVVAQREPSRSRTARS